ncbi:DMT family transporter [Vallitalea okinawensis]|uniref:DMT family transporter n=1 Tax=Vallitalea okinawensis TaxID=2078660 RepID=UPI000CFB6B16|nr:DMT family transporter [Vallitalea okinawensis]
MYKGFALLNGVLIAIMIALNSMLSMATDAFISLLIIHGVGLITISLIILFKRVKLVSLKGIPFYLLLAGAIGVISVFLNNAAFISIGAALTIGLGLYGQLIASVIIDHFGLLGMKKIPLNKKKLIGFAIMAFGILIMMMG